jgi:hypothetical protein
MNKRGNIFFGVSVGIFLYVMGVLFIPFLTDDITSARTNLDCTNTSITDGTKLTCLNVDIVIPYFIWFLLCLLLGYIAGGMS